MSLSSDLQNKQSKTGTTARKTDKTIIIVRGLDTLCSIIDGLTDKKSVSI